MLQGLSEILSQLHGLIPSVREKLRNLDGTPRPEPTISKSLGCLMPVYPQRELVTYECRGDVGNKEAASAGLDAER